MDEKRIAGEPIANHKTGETRSQLMAKIPIPGPGKKPDTPEQKLEKKAIKQFIAEYQERLAAALPLIDPVLIKKAKGGDVPAIKELHDRVMGKAPQRTDITSGDKPLQPILVKFIGDEDSKDTEGV